LLTRENSFISALFEGEMLCNITCLSCKHKVYYFEQVGELSLDIQRQISYSNLWNNKKQANKERSSRKLDQQLF